MPSKRKATSAVKSIKKTRSKSKAKASKYISKKKAYKPKIKQTQVRRRAPLSKLKLALTMKYGSECTHL